MKKPNFFIIGMPRASTTFLHKHLAKHPEIYMSDDKKCAWHHGKEPHFFGSDLTALQCPPRLTQEQYLKLFSGADAKIIGESSTSYLLSTKAAEEIYDFNPDAKILISLRNPVDQCYSLFTIQTASIPVSVADYTVPQFEDAMNDHAAAMHSAAWFVENNFYRKNIIDLPEGIRRYQRKFGEENVKIVIYDDIEKVPEKAYAEILEFLGVKPDFLPQITPQHLNKVFVRGWLAPYYRFLKSIKILVKIKQMFLPNYHPAELLFFKTAPRAPLSPLLRDKFTKEFTPAVEELEKITGRDLSAWKSMASL